MQQQRQQQVPNLAPHQSQQQQQLPTPSSHHFVAGGQPPQSQQQQAPVYHYQPRADQQPQNNNSYAQPQSQYQRPFNGGGGRPPTQQVNQPAAPARTPLQSVYSQQPQHQHQHSAQLFQSQECPPQYRESGPLQNIVFGPTSIGTHLNNNSTPTHMQVTSEQNYKQLKHQPNSGLFNNQDQSFTVSPQRGAKFQVPIQPNQHHQRHHHDHDSNTANSTSPKTMGFIGSPTKPSSSETWHNIGHTSRPARSDSDLGSSPALSNTSSSSSSTSPPYNGPTSHSANDEVVLKQQHLRGASRSGGNIHAHNDRHQPMHNNMLPLTSNLQTTTSYQIDDLTLLNTNQHFGNKSGTHHQQSVIMGSEYGTSHSHQHHHNQHQNNIHHNHHNHHHHHPSSHQHLEPHSQAHCGSSGNSAHNIRPVLSPVSQSNHAISNNNVPVTPHDSISSSAQTCAFTFASDSNHSSRATLTVTGPLISAQQQQVAQISYPNHNVTHGASGTSILMSQSPIKNSDIERMSQNCLTHITCNDDGGDGSSNNPDRGGSINACDRGPAGLDNDCALGKLPPHQSAMLPAAIRQDRRPVGLTTVNYDGLSNTKGHTDTHGLGYQPEHFSRSQEMFSPHVEAIPIGKSSSDVNKRVREQRPAIETNTIRTNESHSACETSNPQESLRMTSSSVVMSDNVFDAPDKNLINRSNGSAVAGDSNGNSGGPQQILCKVCGDKAR